MKKKICMIMIVVLVLVVHSSLAEGILPGLSETVGVGMPSLSEALLRYPVSETENEDGSITELFTNVSEANFDTFSVYLESQDATLANYKVENGILTAEIQAKGASFHLSYDSRSGEAKVIYPSGTFDAWVRAAKTHFDALQEFLTEGKIDEATAELLLISKYNEYAPVEDLLKRDRNFATNVQQAKTAPYRIPGNVVMFGHYEQDNNTANGPEPIEWIVLDIKNEKVLLLSKYGLNTKPYNTEEINVSWEKCTLRDWLNSEFLQSAFSEEERGAILTTELDNDNFQGGNIWNEETVNDTKDQIFLLSSSEAYEFLNVKQDDRDNIKARVAPTAYTIAQDIWLDDYYKTDDGKATGWWWLRAPVYNLKYAAVVDHDGSRKNHGVNNTGGIVRPAFWLNLKSGIF